MEDIKQVAKAAKKRMKSNFWADCKRNIDENTTFFILKKVRPTLSDRLYFQFLFLFLAASAFLRRFTEGDS